MTDWPGDASDDDPGLGTDPMLLNLIRAVFVLVCAGLAVRLARVFGGTVSWSLLFPGVIVLAVLVLTVDVLTPRKRVQTISAVYIGLIVGLILSNYFQIAIEPTLSMFYSRSAIPPDLPAVVSGVLTAIICYICVSTLIQTKDDFRFIIPYLEFSKEVRGPGRSSWTPR